MKSLGKTTVASLSFCSSGCSFSLAPFIFWGVGYSAPHAQVLAGQKEPEHPHRVACALYVDEDIHSIKKACVRDWRYGEVKKAISQPASANVGFSVSSNVLEAATEEGYYKMLHLCCVLEHVSVFVYG